MIKEKNLIENMVFMNAIFLREKPVCWGKSMIMYRKLNEDIKCGCKLNISLIILAMQVYIILAVCCTPLTFQSLFFFQMQLCQDIFAVSETRTSNKDPRVILIKIFTPYIHTQKRLNIFTVYICVETHI